MKYAIFSDVHGNAPALRLALEDARQHGAEGFLFAGDYCISAPWANEVVGLIRSLPNAQAISGNDESHLDVSDGDDGQYEAARWCAGSITPDNRAWLDALPEALTLHCEGISLHMAHSSEAFVGKALHQRYRTSLLPTHFPDGKVSRETLLTDFRTFAQTDGLREAIAALEKGVYIFGHNHIQAWGDFGGRILVNPGSVGLPLDCGDFGACYTLLTIADGAVFVEERRIPYDVEALIALVKTTGQYQAARVWTEAIFSEWRTCREKVFYLLWHAEGYARRIGDERRPFARDTWEAAYAEFAANSPLEKPFLYI